MVLKEEEYEFPIGFLIYWNLFLIIHLNDVLKYKIEEECYIPLVKKIIQEFFVNVPLLLLL